MVFRLTARCVVMSETVGLLWSLKAAGCYRDRLLLNLALAPTLSLTCTTIRKSSKRQGFKSINCWATAITSLVSNNVNYERKYRNNIYSFKKLLRSSLWKAFLYVYFYPGMLVVHWQHVWDQCRAEKMKHFTCYCMVDLNLFCIHSSINCDKLLNTMKCLALNHESPHCVLQMAVDTVASLSWPPCDTYLNQKFQIWIHYCVRPFATDFQSRSYVIWHISAIFFHPRFPSLYGSKEVCRKIFWLEVMKSTSKWKWCNK